MTAASDTEYSKKAKLKHYRVTGTSSIHWYSTNARYPEASGLYDRNIPAGAIVTVVGDPVDRGEGDTEYFLIYGDQTGYSYNLRHCLEEIDL